MGDISFVVVSTPRSGTTFTADLLRSMGVHCDHEYYFNPDHRITHDDAHEKFGDASWMAAPFLRSLPKDTVILHQVRDPLYTIDSMIDTGHFNFEHADNPYIRFIRKHVPFPEGLDVVGRGMFFWAYWHRLIEREASAHQRPWWRYQLERLDAARIASVVGHEIDPRTAAMFQRTTPNNNTRGQAGTHSITEDVLTDTVRAMRREYGY